MDKIWIDLWGYGSWFKAQKAGIIVCGQPHILKVRAPSREGSLQEYSVHTPKRVLKLGLTSGLFFTHSLKEKVYVVFEIWDKKLCHGWTFGCLPTVTQVNNRTETMKTTRRECCNIARNSHRASSCSSRPPSGSVAFQS